MKKSILILVLLSTLQFYTQNNFVDIEFSPKFINYENNGNVESIKLNQIFIRRNIEKNTLDSVSEITDFKFYRNGNLKSATIYSSKNIDEIYKNVKFDSMGRVIKISNKNSYPISAQMKYFNERKIPDTINIYNQDNKLTIQNVFEFENELVTRKIIYEESKLSYYYEYEYDENQRLITKIFNNTPNGPGISFGEGFGRQSKDAWPNDTVFYYYRMIKDTLQTEIYNENKLIKRIKKVENINSNVTIEENAERLLSPKQIIITIDWGDSIKVTRKNYGRNEFLSSINYHLTTKDKIEFNNINFDRNGKEKNTYKKITNIITINDEYGNWIEKKYVEDREIVRVIKRNIHYYSH